MVGRRLRVFSIVTYGIAFAFMGVGIYLLMDGSAMSVLSLVCLAMLGVVSLISINDPSPRTARIFRPVAALMGAASSALAGYWCVQNAPYAALSFAVLAVGCLLDFWVFSRRIRSVAAAG